MSEDDWLDRWNRLDASRRERLGHSIGRLMEEGILLKGPAASSDEDYRLLDRHEETARGYLRTMGWDLTVDRGRGVVQASNLEGRCRVSFSKAESIVLCLLRLLFHERAATAAWEDEIIVSVGEIVEAYHTHSGDGRRLTKQDLTSALRRFGRLKLVALPRPFEPRQETGVRLRRA